MVPVANLLAKSHTLTIMANADRIGGLIAANLRSGSCMRRKVLCAGVPALRPSKWHRSF